MLELSTREVATLIWMAAFFVWVLRLPDVRRAAFRVLTTALHWKIIVPTVIIVLYSLVVVWVLYLVGFWRTYLLKDTIIWLLFSGLALGWSGVGFKGAPPNWARVVADQFKALVIAEYLINTYTFNLWIELLLVPLVTLIVILTTVAQGKPEHESIAALGQFLQGLLGLVVLGFAVSRALTTMDALEYSVAIREITLPAILSAALVPIAYIFAVVSAYELLFIRTEFPLDIEPAQKWSHRWRLFRKLGLNLSAIRSYRETHRYELSQAKIEKKS